MFTPAGIIFCIFCLLCFGAPLYSQTLPGLPNQTLPSKVDSAVFHMLYNPPKIDDKERSRAQWAELFGVDLWYPYYKTKEIEAKVTDKLGVKVFKLKGKPKFGENQFKYTFTVKY